MSTDVLLVLDLCVPDVLPKGELAAVVLRVLVTVVLPEDAYFERVVAPPEAPSSSFGYFLAGKSRARGPGGLGFGRGGASGSLSSSLLLNSVSLSSSV